MHTSFTTLTASAVAATALALGAGVPAASASAHPSQCGVSQLSAQIKQGSPGAGNRYATLTLTNRSHRGCDVSGYVGLGLENAAGRPVPTKAVRTERSAVHSVYLAPGARARTQLHWGAVQGTGDTAGGTCFRAPTHVLVTPPNAYSSLQLRWDGGVVCEGGTIDMTPLTYAG